MRERLLASSYASFQLLMVEEAIPWPEYRVVVFRDEVVACYRRRPLEVKGNGQATIEELLRRKQKKFSQSARAKRFNIHDPRIARRLRKEQKDFATILPAGERYTVHDISNSSAGGEIEDYTERIHPYWSALCIQVVADMGLRLCGVDLACPDLESIGANYSILELNAAPGLSNYVAMGAVQKKRVREMYGKIFSEEFDVPTARLSPTIGRWKEIAADDLS
ncbi:hypothetical protein EPA93_11715 [Ktedonosporobacter rubrisoli]|uniref:ATP-grasp domain-containing protein n=1 Tax=Ktedonosporobacter rubrisoli TaxID=2509675 RepID=A0A4P6JNA0_KTERU|nr:hypothetical protein [Ktedonosporobacter rubrisoli]QBD76633.1 hypothetical protein EPA93_11715 [Ktedonosporobacter rubrisoli]